MAAAVKQKGNSLLPILLAICLSGIAALIYEVVWTKVLSLVIGSTVYALSTMLSAFMGGLSLGAFVAARKADKYEDPLYILGLLELGIGIFGVATLIIIGYMQPLYALIYSFFHLSFASFSIVQFILCFFIMMLPTTLMGATFPFACKALVKVDGNVGKDTGYVYSINTLGAIIGSMSAGFLLIPFIGLKGANITAASINILTAIILIAYTRGWSWGKSTIVYIAVAAGIVSMTPSLYAFQFVYPVNFYMAERFKGVNLSALMFMGTGDEGEMEMLMNNENAYGVVQVFRNKGAKDKFLMNNGKIEGGTGVDNNNQLLAAFLPIAMVPDAKSYLNIGLGSGMTLAAALASEVDDIDSVEVNPVIMDVVETHFFPGIFAQPDRPKVIIADARNYLALSSKKYDIISSEPSYPTDDSVSHLFTREFFSLVKSRLSEKGVFCQWIPFHILSHRGSTVMMKTFLDVFPNSYFWNVRSAAGRSGEDILMIGTNFSKRETYEAIKSRVPLDQLVGGAEIFSPTITDVQANKIILNEKIPVNRDDLPIIEFLAAKSMLHN